MRKGGRRFYAGVSGSYSYYEIDVPEITQDIIDNGVVLVYLNNSLDPTMEDEWALMPCIVIYDDLTFSFNCAYSPGTLSIILTTSETEWPFSADSYYHLKIVILTRAA